MVRFNFDTFENCNSTVGQKYAESNFLSVSISVQNIGSNDLFFLEKKSYSFLHSNMRKKTLFWLIFNLT